MGIDQIYKYYPDGGTASQWSRFFAYFTVLLLDHAARERKVTPETIVEFGERAHKNVVYLEQTHGD